MPHISVVTTVYHAEKILPELYRRLTETIGTITEDYEIIMVEDGGADGSWPAIVGLAARDSRVKGIKLSRNFGQHPAITAGLDYVDGDWVVVMDCDLQDPPAEIPKLYRRALEGFDIVIGRRIHRRDSFVKKAWSQAFYKLFSYLSGTRNNGEAANFRIMSRKVVSAFRCLRERHRFFIALIDWMGFATDYIDVEHAHRYEGKTTYNYPKLIKLAVDTIVSHSDRPLQLAVYMGFGMALFSFLTGSGYLVWTLTHKSAVSGWPSLIISIYFLAGVNTLFLGVLGIYQARTFDEVKKRPLYLVDQETTSLTTAPMTRRSDGASRDVATGVQARELAMSKVNHIASVKNR
jgi:polyisoprenyl-phosphate glycosyltransferase